jgi:hypothetical protein
MKLQLATQNNSIIVILDPINKQLVAKKCISVGP